MAVPQILQQLNGHNIQQAIQPIRQLMGMVRSAQNPALMLNQLAMNNPLLKQAMDITQQYGGDPMKAVQALAEQKGIDPQEIFNLLK